MLVSVGPQEGGGKIVIALQYRTNLVSGKSRSWLLLCSDTTFESCSLQCVLRVCLTVSAIANVVGEHTVFSIGPIPSKRDQT